MYQYLIMQNPGHNRVFYDQSLPIALAELTLTAQKIDISAHCINTITLAGIHYLSIKSNTLFQEKQFTILSKLSFLFALFKIEQQSDNTLTLSPITLPHSHCINPKLSTLMKYSGKTNELFTKMMINIGLLVSRFNYGHTIHVLDPVCGRGTTLFESAIYGYHATGIDIEGSSIHKACTLFKKYLEQEKYKHTLTKNKLPSAEGTSAVMHRFEYTKTSKDYKIISNRKKMILTQGNTQHASHYFKQSSFHIVVADLPYGIAHHNTGKNSLKIHTKKTTKSPYYLLENSLPGWVKVLKKGGTLVLAWNTFLLSKKAITTLLENNGLIVFKETPFNQFEHRVDQSIKRDIIVAIK